MRPPGVSYPRYFENHDNVYSQGNLAILTCDSGYVIRNMMYLKSARVVCNYTPLDGSTWKILENDSTTSNISAACIRGNLGPLINFHKYIYQFFKTL